MLRVLNETCSSTPLLFQFQIFPSETCYFKTKSYFKTLWTSFSCTSATCCSFQVVIFIFKLPLGSKFEISKIYLWKNKITKSKKIKIKQYFNSISHIKRFQFWSFFNRFPKRFSTTLLLWIFCSFPKIYQFWFWFWINFNFPLVRN